MRMYRPLKLVGWGVALLALAAVLSSVARADEPILIRFAHVVAPATPKGSGALRFKALAEERLAGRVRVEVYPLSQKFDDDEALLALLFGDIELAAPSLAKFRAFEPALEVFDLPFLFRDVDHVERFQKSETGQRLLTSMRSRGIEGLAYWSNGMRIVSAKRPVRMPEDARDLRFRIEPSAVFQAQWNRLGVVAIPMPFGRLVDALRDGVVNAQENAWSNILSRHVEAYTPHFTELDHSFLGYMVVTSTAFWQGLPDDIRTSLEAILAEVTVGVNERAREQAWSDRAILAAMPGIAIHTPSADERAAWEQALTPIWAQFEDEIGRDVIDAAIAARDPAARP